MTDALPPDVALWRAVVAQAIDDATRRIKPNRTDERLGEQLRHRDQAREWLLSGGRDFVKVCHLALLDPQAVRDRALKLSWKDWSPWIHRGQHVAEAYR